jgi:hypothetical protein
LLLGAVSAITELLGAVRESVGGCAGLSVRLMCCSGCAGVCWELPRYVCAIAELLGSLRVTAWGCAGDYWVLLGGCAGDCWGCVHDYCAAGGCAGDCWGGYVRAVGGYVGYCWQLFAWLMWCWVLCW